MAELLTPENAHAFARMLHAGAPAQEAAKYFVNAHATREEIQAAANLWMQQTDVTRAFKALNGGVAFEELESRDQRRDYALEKHYDEMAFFLYTHNYAELQGTDKQKADTCRDALEKKLAGMAGHDPVTEFWQELLRLQKQKTTDSDEVRLQ